MIDDKDKQIFDLTKHIRVLTEMMAEDHEIILSLRTQLFLERNRNDREANERTTRNTVGNDREAKERNVRNT
jgi:hypothetical protein